jgi:hypothetical protein
MDNALLTSPLPLEQAPDSATAEKQSYEPPEAIYVPFSTEERISGCIINQKTNKLYDC